MVLPGLVRLIHPLQQQIARVVVGGGWFGGELPLRPAATRTHSTRHAHTLIQIDRSLACVPSCSGDHPTMAPIDGKQQAQPSAPPRSRRPFTGAGSLLIGELLPCTAKNPAGPMDGAASRPRQMAGMGRGHQQPASGCAAGAGHQMAMLHAVWIASTSPPGVSPVRAQACPTSHRTTSSSTPS